MRKIGIFGGSFDPIHLGHLRPAFEMLDALSLDSMLFIPSGHPPHRGAPRASPQHRLAMLRAAIGDEPCFKVDERELQRAAPSYTVDTLTELRKQHPADVLVLVVGMDAFLGFPGWHRWRDIFGLAHVAVMHRPGWALETEGEIAGVLKERRVDVLQGVAGQVLLQAVTQLEISSSRVRELAAKGGELRWLVPDAVRAYIRDSKCYA
ncbi:MAG TPA: nicotinate-nucleotide adenylyltransferase [Gammaproteobacteria bacterium]|jgi:nicotinate-nucleotide adenylyltransferase|nr:nicotinate-nucleotide adenylyltransferase [Gammaproteobacteria bacterium]